MIAWYTRPDGDHLILGVIDTEDGAAITADTEVLVFGAANPDDIITEDEPIPLDDKYIIGFVKGIAAELLQIDGTFRQDYKIEFERVKSEIRSRNVNALSFNKPIKKAIL